MKNINAAMHFGNTRAKKREEIVELAQFGLKIDPQTSAVLFKKAAKLVSANNKDLRRKLLKKAKQAKLTFIRKNDV